MAIKINNIVLSLEDDIDILKNKAAKKLNIDKGIIGDLKIIRESVDARKKDDIKLNYSIKIICDNEEKIFSRCRDKDIILENEDYKKNITSGTEKLEFRPVIVGMGPAGLFAGLLLARRGYKPLIVERGQDVDSRTITVDGFWKGEQLNINSNVQFGEGGAGTFSDGKLTTRIKDYRCDYIIQELVDAGAPAEIIYSGKPHVGTDILKNVVKNIREEIKKHGGEVFFNHKLEDIIIENGKVKSAIINGNEVPCNVLILALGHSARDTYEMLYKKNVSMLAKAFAIGVRIEHPQDFIDEAQFGKFAKHPKLRAADYRLAYTDENLNRSVYSFCMCPGGVVVAAASEENRLVTNGMSYHSRNGKNANSALVVSVSPVDFNGSSPLAGIEFQRHYEHLAYNLGGANYNAPVQLLGDFMKHRTSKSIGNIEPSYKPGWEFADLTKCLPTYTTDMLKIGLDKFNNKIKGFAMEDAVLTGIETRTSAPLRIVRDSELQSVSVSGIYPAGEGAGYAGGIVSAAVDGLKVAESILGKYFYCD